MTPNDGGPAFPIMAKDMSLRDWFAGQAFQSAWLAMDGGYYQGGSKDVAECAYQMADAMLAARGGAK